MRASLNGQDDEIWLKWRLPANPQRLQHYYRLSMSWWNNDNGEAIKSNGWNRAYCLKIIRDQGQNSEGLINPFKLVSRWTDFEVSLSPFKSLVRNLIFKTSPLMLGCLYKTLFRHLLIRLFNYACSLIQILQIPTSDSDLMCLLSLKGYF